MKKVVCFVSILSCVALCFFTCATNTAFASETPFFGSRLFLPSTKSKHAAVVLLHGSEGGSNRSVDVEAKFLRDHGYSVLSYCYFDCSDNGVSPRQSLKNVEVTDVFKAIAWIRHRPYSNGKVFLYGFSRGAELTLIIGSLKSKRDERPDGLIAHAPSDAFNGSSNPAWNDPKCWSKDRKWDSACGDDLKSRDYTKSSWLISGKTVPWKKRIEIEKYDGPILLTVGTKDEEWPYEQTERIEKTLKGAGRTPEVFYFTGQGHGFKGVAEQRRRQLVLKFLDRAS